MSPLEFKNIKKWNTILKQISASTKMAASLTDKNGNIIETNGKRCPLCHIIRKNKESLTYICSQCNRSMLKEVKQTFKPVVDCCDAGLSRIAVPVIQGNNVIGQITACGSVQNKGDIDSFLIAKQTGISETEVETLATDTPLVAKEEVKIIALEINNALNPSRN